MKKILASLLNNLLTSITIAFIVGITFSSQLKLSQSALHILTGVLLAATVLLFIFYRSRYSHGLIYFLLPVFAGIGCLHAQIYSQLPSQFNHIYNMIDKKREVVLIGTMTQMAGFDGKTSQTVIELRSIRFKNRKEWQNSQGKIVLRVQGKWPVNILPGDTLAIRATVKRPDSYRTPGAFDYAQYLARKNIWITGSVRSPLLLHNITEQQSYFHFARYFPERIRTRIGAFIDTVVTVGQAPVYRAILLGDRSHLHKTTLEAFKNSGTMHILAISGLHMAVVGSLLYFCIYWILSRSEQLLLRYNIRKWAVFITMPFLIFYALLAGMNSPVFRSVIMSTVIIIAICTDRKKSPAPLISLAALIILVTDPLQLYSVSFQLSFAATISILFFFPILKTFLFQKFEVKHQPLLLSTSVLRWILAGLLVSTVATLATLPLSLYSFNRVSLIGPIANLIIEPLVCFWGLIAGFFAIPLLFISPEISSFFFHIGTIGLKYAMNAATFFASLPYSHLWLPTPSIWHIVLYYICFLYLIIAGIKNTYRSIAAIIASGLLLVFFFFYLPNILHIKEHRLQISFLDVGQGSATLIEFPSGFLALIDGGGSSYRQPTIGERVIAPFLWHQGIQHINSIAITHPDADHYNGLDFITHHFAPDNIWVKTIRGHDHGYAMFIHSLVQRNIPLTIPYEKQILSADKMSLECITNFGRWKNIPSETTGRNQLNSGLILKAKTANFSVLFPGDIGKNSEKALVDKKYPLRADIMLSPHHGSKTSNSKEFLSTSAPKFLIVSASRRAKGRFPDSRLAPLCKELGITLLTTGQQGTIEVIVGKKYYHIYGYQKQKNNPLLPLKRYLVSKRKLKIDY